MNEQVKHDKYMNKNELLKDDTRSIRDAPQPEFATNFYKDTNSKMSDDAHSVNDDDDEIKMFAKEING